MSLAVITRLALCGLALVGGPVQAERLEDVVRFALQNHPRAQAANAGLRAAEFGLSQARSARYPQFALIADPGRQFSRDSSRSVDVGDVGARSTVLLYDGGRTRAAVEREENRIDVATSAARFTNEDLAARIVDVYTEGFKQERLAALAVDNVATHQDLYNRVQQIVDIDRGRASDLLQVGARLEQAKLALAARRGAANEAAALLADLVGRRVEGIDPLRDPRTEMPASLEQSMKLLDLHPSARAADAEASAVEQEWRIASAWQRPRLDLQGTVNSPQDFFGKRQYFDAYDFRVAVSWVPYDGGGGRAGERAAESRFLQARSNAQAVRRELSARVAEIWAQIETRRSRADTYNRLVEQSVQVREAYWQQFTIGRRSIIDLLNAENESFQSRLGAENERLEVVQTQYRLLAALARLTSWLGIASPGDSKP